VSSLRQPQRIDELLNYRLQRLHAASGAPVIRLLEGRHGISRREWRLLAALAEGGAMSPSDLATVMQLDRPRTSRAIGALAGKGLLQRVERAGDARRADVALTGAGHQLYQVIFPQVAAINRQVVEVLDEAELVALDKALARLNDHARKLNERLVQDAKADRRRGGTRRIFPAPDDAA